MSFVGRWYPEGLVRPSSRRRPSTGRALAIVSLVVLGVAPTRALAQTTDRDVEVAARAVAFLASKPSGEQATAVIYSPDNPTSKADADALVRILSSGIEANKISLGVPRLVSVDDLSALDGVDVAFVTAGLGANHADISKAAAARNLLTVSADLECARQGHCVVGIQGQPSVEILISKQASQATGQEFSTAFLMMAKEI